MEIGTKSSVVNLESKESDEGIDSIRSIRNEKIEEEEEEEGKEEGVKKVQGEYDSIGLRDSADHRFVDLSLNHLTIVDRKRSSIGRKIEDKGICHKSGCWIS